MSSLYNFLFNVEIYPPLWKNYKYLNVVDPERRFSGVGEANLAAEDVEAVVVGHHGVLLQAARPRYAHLQLRPLILTYIVRCGVAGGGGRGSFSHRASPRAAEGGEFH